MAHSLVDWRCSACWRTNKANTQRCARCGIFWTHGNDQTYVPQKSAHRSPRRSTQSSAWNYTGWSSQDQWSDQAWQHGQQQERAAHNRPRGNTPRKQTPKGKKKQKSNTDSMPPPEPPWHSQYRGEALPSGAGAEGQAASENLTILATALKEANTPIPARVQHIVAENSAPVPTSKGLKNAVDKMDKARKKLRDAQAARSNLHTNWRTYIADSLKRWTQFAEQFGKDDADLAAKVKAAQDKLQSTKEEVESRKQAFEELDEESPVDISDEEMTDRIDTAENIQASLASMVSQLHDLQQKADEAIIDANENKSKRPRLEEPGEETKEAAPPPLAGGLASTAMVPFGKPGK